MANTREKSGASSRLSSTYPPTSPLAPASRATLGSFADMDLKSLDCSFSDTSLADGTESLHSCTRARPSDFFSASSWSR